MTSDPKKIIIDTALAMGFENVAIASLEPLDAERKFYEQWLSSGYAASMEYLKRNPEKRNTPALLCPEAYSAIVLFASYYTNIPDDPGPQFGRVARYAVGSDYHSVLPAKLAELKNRLEGELQRPLLGKYFTDDVELFEQALANRHGLGFTGKNSLIIGPRLSGSYHFVAEMFTDIQLEPDVAYEGTCGKCFRCGDACPTGAIVGEKTVDSNLCISFLTIENKGAIPVELREKVGSWVFGCDICQEVCPYNKRPPETKWGEFLPQSGVGHYLNLFDILTIRDKKEFLARFGHTALTRPKRNGLIRNALVVIGNRLPQGGAQKIYEFCRSEESSNALLLEHAFWALSRYEDGGRYLRTLYNDSAQCRELLEQYIH